MISITRFLSYFKPKYEIYTDGGFKNGVGTWAFIVVQRNKIIFEKTGRLKKTGSNEMEFTAALQALKHLSPGSRAKIFSDSRIVVDTVNVWMNQYQKFNWVKPNQAPIANINLIKEIHNLNQQNFIEWAWVKSHSGRPFNEYCDKLCIQART